MFKVDSSLPNIQNQYRPISGTVTVPPEPIRQFDSIENLGGEVDYFVRGIDWGQMQFDSTEMFGSEYVVLNWRKHRIFGLLIQRERSRFNGYSYVLDIHWVEAWN